MFLFPLLLLFLIFRIRNSIFSPLISWQGYSHPHSLECSPTIPTQNQFMAAQYFMIVHSFLFCTHSPTSNHAQQYIPCGPDCNACLTPPTRTRCPPALCTALLDTDRVTGSVSAAALSPSAYLSITPHSLYLSLCLAMHGQHQHQFSAGKGSTTNTQQYINRLHLHPLTPTINTETTVAFTTV